MGEWHSSEMHSSFISFQKMSGKMSRAEKYSPDIWTQVHLRNGSRTNCYVKVDLQRMVATNVQQNIFSLDVAMRWHNFKITSIINKLVDGHLFIKKKCQHFPQILF